MTLGDKPTPPARRPKQHLTFRSGVAGIEWLDKIAYDQRVSRTDVIRACFVVARRRENEVINHLKEQK